MYNTTILGKILKLIPKQFICAANQKYNGNAYVKKFKTWDHLVILIFNQIVGSKSIRDTEVQFNACQNCHYHMDIKGVFRSTFSDANRRRNSGIFRKIAIDMLGFCINKHEKRELLNALTVLDSTPIRLNGRGHKWAEGNKTSRCRGLKVHIQSLQKSQYIEEIEITDPNVNDITVAQKLLIKPGRTYVFDKGYYDYNWWHKIITRKANFITRLKTNSIYKVLDTKNINQEDKDIIKKDEIILLNNQSYKKGKRNNLKETPLRLIEVYDLTTRKRYKFITNLLDTPATIIASYYRNRWSIELLFKWLKQNLRVKSFLSENENAIKTQIYIAVIVYTLINLIKTANKQQSIRMIDLLSLLRVCLFFRVNPKIPPPKAIKHRLGFFYNLMRLDSMTFTGQ